MSKSKICVLVAVLAIVAITAFVFWPKNDFKAGVVMVAGDGFAIHGYDAVAYFVEQDAVEGSASYTYDWNGATWLFANEDNKSLFAGDPEKYAPQYGGWCAYGVSGGYAAEIDPQAWTIDQGKLYLNYNAEVMDEWREDIPGFLESSENNWPTLKADLDRGEGEVYWK